MESDVSLGGSVTPVRCHSNHDNGPRNATRRDAVGCIRNTIQTTLVIPPLTGRIPPTLPTTVGNPFRLILPEAIAIGVRFSHASRTSSHSWRIAQ